MVKKLDSKNFAEVLRENEIVLVDFYTDWCGPCKMIAPYIEEIAKEREDVVVGKVNVDDAYDVAAKCNVVGIPTVIVFKNGKEAVRSVGYRKKHEILDMIEREKENELNVEV